jgi:hypothetical protein
VNEAAHILLKRLCPGKWFTVWQEILLLHGNTYFWVMAGSGLDEEDARLSHIAIIRSTVVGAAMDHEYSVIYCGECTQAQINFVRHVTYAVEKTNNEGPFMIAQVSDLLLRMEHVLTMRQMEADEEAEDS